MTFQALLAIFGAVTELINKGKPAVEGLFALLANHNIAVRDEAIVRMILEAEAAKAEIQAEIDARAKAEAEK